MNTNSTSMRINGPARSCVRDYKVVEEERTSTRVVHYTKCISRSMSFE